jgi:hypothetical protein
MVIGVVAGVLLAATALAFARKVSAVLSPSGVEQYCSQVTSIEPVVEGLVVSVAGGGESVTLENRTGQQVIVLGYAGEPYLRFGAGGVDENVASMSTQLNDGEAPAARRDKSVVTWEHRSDQPRFTWQDLRVRWGTQQHASIVARGSRSPRPVSDWTLPITFSGQQVSVRGAVGRTATSWSATWQLVLGGVFLTFLIVFMMGVLSMTRRSRVGCCQGGRMPTVLERESVLVGEHPSTHDPYGEFRLEVSSPHPSRAALRSGRRGR